MRDYGALLQRAGFALPVADAETLTVLYASPREVMREIRALGGGNVLLARSKRPLSRHTLERAEGLYRERHGTPDGQVSATFEIVYLSGWAPDQSQQKPLKPGSAARRLADALGTTEQPAGDKAAFPTRRETCEKRIDRLKEGRMARVGVALALVALIASIVWLLAPRGGIPAVVAPGVQAQLVAKEFNFLEGPVGTDRRRALLHRFAHQQDLPPRPRWPDLRSRASRAAKPTAWW